MYMWSDIWLHTTDSSSFDMNGKREMGLKLGTCVMSSDTFFNKGLIMASLNTVGTYPSSMDLFRMAVM